MTYAIIFVFIGENISSGNFPLAQKFNTFSQTKFSLIITFGHYDLSLFSITGDKEKEEWPTSNYTQSFPQKHVDDQSLRHHNHTSSTTIQGDIRSHNGNDIYVTSTDIMFPPRELIAKTNIPQSVKVYVKVLLVIKMFLCVEIYLILRKLKGSAVHYLG